MCARFKFTVPEQFTKGMTSNLFNPNNVVEAKPGNTVPIVTPNGYQYMAVWRGFARIETLKQVWLAKGWKPVKIVNGVSFKERDTVGGSRDLKEFKMHLGQGVGAVAKAMTSPGGKKYVEVKMVTQPAQGDVKGVHHRMPKIIE